MRKLFTFYLLRPFLALLIMFSFFKALFLIFHAEQLKEVPFYEILKVFFQSLKLDISATCYILIIPFFLLILQYFIRINLWKRIHEGYLLFIAFFCSVINVADTLLYAHWSSKISLKSLLFIKMPTQVFATMSSLEILMAILFIGFHFMLAFVLLRYFVFSKKLFFTLSNVKFFLGILLAAFLLIVGIRGGVQNIPINQSVAYFSSNNILNVAGVNPFWNFMNTLVQNKKYLNENPYLKVSDEKATEYLSHLFAVEKDTSIQLFTINKPNIVSVVMEGVNANVFDVFGAKTSYAPHIDSLFHTGLLFRQMYASGFRSDQGLVALYGGFPPTPVSSIAAQPEKFMKLPSFNKQLVEAGYHSASYMGVEPEFGNLKSYLVYNGFDKQIDINDFPNRLQTASLGVPDAPLFSRVLTEMQEVKEPFYSLIFTSTTHEPYDMPFNEQIETEREKYLNCVAYLDTVLNTFFSEVQKMPWYENTIFILSSDHSHSLPNNYGIQEDERYHIPFFIFGEPLKKEFVNTTNDRIFSQVDVPKTILNQLGLASDSFIWSKDMLNPYSQEFAFYTYVEGYVLKTKNCNAGWEYRYDKPYGTILASDSVVCIEQGQAFLQKLYDTYLSY